MDVSLSTHQRHRKNPEFSPLANDTVMKTVVSMSVERFKGQFVQGRGIGVPQKSLDAIRNTLQRELNLKTISKENGMYPPLVSHPSKTIINGTNLSQNARR